MTSPLVSPHGGSLCDLIVNADRASALRAAARDLPSWTLSPRQTCDLELLICGAFSPLSGFMTRRDYESVCQRLRLADGTLWPIPITLDLPDAVATRLESGGLLALRDAEGVPLAVLHLEEIWTPDRQAEAALVYGTTNREHPGVADLERSHPVLCGGRVEALQMPVHHDFRALRQTPAEVRADFDERGWHRVVAFQTRNPMHRAHQELALRAVRETDAALLIHPVVGMTKPGDVDHYTRVRCYRSVLETYPPGVAKLALLPLSMRMAGPREALWHAIIRKNYGCTHLIVGRDHAGPGRDSSGRPFYQPYAAQALVRRHEAELGMSVVPFETLVYVRGLDRYVPQSDVPAGADVLDLSGTQLRRLLAEGHDIPEWFTFPAVARELQRRHPRRRQQGFTVFFTGLSGAGKSTLANALCARLLEIGDRAVTLLDGDLVRLHLSSELGFSKEHRDLNIRRIGFVASEITRHGGAAICAPIAPYDAVRRDVRAMVAAHGGFLLVYVSTPIDVCERRDRKGLYARARAGLIDRFTGVSDPYEPPQDADVVVDAATLTVDEGLDLIVRRLQDDGYVE